MVKILVSGLINVETTLKIEAFPLEYNPVNYSFFGVNSTVSGVGMNVAKALTTLGGKVNLLSIIGKDFTGENILSELKKLGVDTEFIRRDLGKTCQSVIIYENGGRRQIHTDLKDIQERSYDIGDFEKALEDCEIAVLCNINFSRPLLKIARDKNKIIATDVHAIENIDDAYNSDFMKYSNILFMSHERIKEPVENFAKKVIERYDNDVLVIGCGAKGALLYVKKDNFMGSFEAVRTREVINTIGAGDSLFSSFIYFYNKDKNPYAAIKKAIVFASYKIGSVGAAEGFLDEVEINRLSNEVYGEGNI